MGNDLLVKR